MMLLVGLPLSVGWLFALGAAYLVIGGTDRLGLVVRKAAPWGICGGALAGLTLSLLVGDPPSISETGMAVMAFGVSGAGWVGLTAGLWYCWGKPETDGSSR